MLEGLDDCPRDAEGFCQIALAGRCNPVRQGCRLTPQQHLKVYTELAQAAEAESRRRRQGFRDRGHHHA